MTYCITLRRGTSKLSELVPNPFDDINKKCSKQKTDSIILQWMAYRSPDRWQWEEWKVWSPFPFVPFWKISFKKGISIYPLPFIDKSMHNKSIISFRVPEIVHLSEAVTEATPECCITRHLIWRETVTRAQYSTTVY